jgi:hypothetical protein
MDYSSWHTVTITKLRITNPVMDEIRVWCRSNFGLIDRPIHTWDWGSHAGYSLWFVFKNQTDYTQFILTWGEYV